MNYICRTLSQPDSQFDADEYDRLKTRMADSQSHPQPQAEIHPDARSDARSGFNPPLYLACGPLLRFTGIEDGVWHGSILVVTEDRRSVYRPVPVVRVYTSSAGTGTGVGIDAGIVKLSRTGRAMRIKSEDEVARGIDHSITADPGHSLFGAEYDIPHPNTDRNTDTDTDADAQEYLTIPAHTLHAEQAHTFFRFDLALPLSPASSTKIVYRLNGSSTPQSFYIPSTAENMHVLFHSCNGFSLSVDSGAFSGPDPLWRDVLRAHTGHSHRHSPSQARPFHIMLGGGDQIYNDAARTHPTTTHFHAWTQSRPLARKRSAPFSPPDARRAAPRLPAPLPVVVLAGPVRRRRRAYPQRECLG